MPKNCVQDDKNSICISVFFFPSSSQRAFLFLPNYLCHVQFSPGFSFRAISVVSHVVRAYVERVSKTASIFAKHVLRSVASARRKK